jgi:hypothetical protein
MIDQYTAEEMGYKKDYDSGSAHTYYRPYKRAKVIFKPNYNRKLYRELKALIEKGFTRFTVEEGRILYE